jgi:hypothetical protein
MSLEPLKLTTLNSMMEKVDRGNKCEVWKAAVIDSSSKTTIAFVKHLPQRELFVECVAAMIARAIQLPTPRPMLVNVHPVKIPELNLSEPTIFFGSEDVGFPSLSQFTDVRSAAEKLKLWPNLLKAGCFDEWIANSDRHSGNIIFNGSNEFSLIDHSHAIPRNFKSRDQTIRNSMLTYAAPATRNDLKSYQLKQKADKSISTFLSLTEEDWQNLTSSNLYCTEEQTSEIIRFLKERLEVLSYLISNQIGYKQPDLYAQL